MSTFSITDERKQVVDFAGPYFDAAQDLLVRRNEEDITGPGTLNGRTLCTVAGTTSADNILAQYRGRVTLLEKPRYSECVAALAASEVDAVTTDDVILAGFAAEPQYKGKLRLVGKGFSEESYGIGVKKGDTEMVTKVNAALKQYIADGSWKAALEKTVGPSGYACPARRRSAGGAATFADEQAHRTRAWPHADRPLHDPSDGRRVPHQGAPAVRPSASPRAAMTRPWQPPVPTRTRPRTWPSSSQGTSPSTRSTGTA